MYKIAISLVQKLVILKRSAIQSDYLINISPYKYLKHLLQMAKVAIHVWPFVKVATLYSLLMLSYTLLV